MKVSNITKCGLLYTYTARDKILSGVAEKSSTTISHAIVLHNQHTSSSEHLLEWNEVTLKMEATHSSETSEQIVLTVYTSKRLSFGRTSNFHNKNKRSFSFLFSDWVYRF